MFSHKKQKSYELRLARVCLASPSLWLKFNPTLNLSGALATGLDVKGKTKKIQMRWWLSYWKLKWVLLQCVSNFGDKLLHRAATFSAAFVCKSSSQPHYYVCVFLCCLFCESVETKTTGKSPAVVSTAVTVVLLSVGGKSKCCSWKLTLQTSQNRNQMESRA